MRRNTLLLVDDMAVNRAILRALFEQEYNILEAENGEQALLLLRQYRAAIAATLLDIVMPVKDGYTVLREMAAEGLLEVVPVIVITAQDSAESEVRAFDLGASDIVSKPFEPHAVRRRVQNIVELTRHRHHLEELVEEQADGLRESKGVLMDALSSVIEHRSLESGQHVLRIRMFTKLLLEDVMQNYPEYGLDERKIDVIASASGLHDIGKIAVPDAVLNKPGRLTEEEYVVMKGHTEKGCEILAGLGRMHDKEYLQYAYNICRYHHERWDGSGYPDGLQGENIPICAQAVSVADAYDALTTHRVYKPAYTPEKASNMILNGECGAFSPRLLECFKHVHESFAQLAREYADGRSPNEDFEADIRQDAYQAGVENTLELGQMKYFAMLRYENSTVMEVDLDAGVYHLVYAQNNDFDLLRSGDDFWASYRAFIEGTVHPEDRQALLADDGIEAFLASGSIKHTRAYRIYNKATGHYLPYERAALRINLDDPRQHKILLIWRALERGSRPARSGKAPTVPTMDTSMIGVFQCRNDGNFTLRYVNDGFVTLLGFSREELATRFDNQWMQMIYPSDRLLVRERFNEQQAAGNEVEIEYRVTTRDQRVLWVLDKSQLFTGEDGVEYLNCFLMDVTQTKREQETLRLTMERHQIILDQTNDILFEWDIPKDTLLFAANWVKKFGYQPISQEVSTRIPRASHIMPEDVPDFMQLLERVRDGAPYGETELRVANADGRYLWTRIRATTQFDDAGKPVKAVGIILDIDSEKRRTQDLIEQAERDQLTQLYNKATAFRRIQRFMRQTGPTDLSAMLIIDLDNFKTINDTFGHMFGDAVLMEVSAHLRRLFRSEDVIARIGGDEFLVYIPGLQDPDVLRVRADALVNAIRGVLAEKLQNCPLSCSVGGAYYPQDAANFQELYQCCDRALYTAKAQGKNRFALYQRRTMANMFGLGRQAVTAKTRIESDEIYDLETAALLQEAARRLYQGKETRDVILSVLEMIGRRYNVCRAYIFEESEDGSYCRNTFEWCREGITPQMAQLQHVSYAEIGDYHENFDENGVFYCPDVTRMPPPQYETVAGQGIQSMLQCAIYNDGAFVGFVGFDDCTEKRMWTQNQIRALTFLAEQLSMFLLKKRAQERSHQAAQDLRTLLNSQNSWIYVVDPDTFEMQYLNAKTLRIAPDARVGMRCHAAFFRRNTPCEHCPARDIRTRRNHTLEVYNPILHVWSMADATLIRWGGKEACLLSCHDITPYKELPPPEEPGGG